MKTKILAAAKSVLVKNGLAAWTIEEVAREAQCVAFLGRGLPDGFPRPAGRIRSGDRGR